MSVKYLGPRSENAIFTDEVAALTKGLSVTGNIAAQGSLYIDPSVSITSYDKDISVNSISNTMTISGGATAKTKTGLSLSSTGNWNGTDNVNRGLYVNVSGGTVNYSAIFSGGNVGIGTNTPSTLLHLSAADYPELSIESTTNTSRSTIKFLTNGNDWEFGARGSASAQYPNSLYIYDNAASAYRTIINSDGYVGFGNVNPQAKLHVTSGTASFNIAYFTNGTFAASNNNSTLLIGGGDSGLGGWENIFFALRKYGSTTGLGSSDSLSRIRLDGTSVQLTKDDGTNVLWVGSNGTYSGNVGIGTSQPTSTFHNAGSTQLKLTTTAVNLALDGTHTHVIVTATGRTITLPTAVGIAGRTYWVKATTGSTSVATTSSQTIDGATAPLTVTSPDGYTFVSDGSNWFIV